MAENKPDSLAPSKVKADVSINDADLDGAMSEQAGLYVHYSSIFASAQYEADMAKNRAELAKATAYKRHRNRATARGIKVSEAMLEAEVQLDTEYQEALKVAAQSKLKSELARQVLEAFKQRKDMLVQKGVARRVELQGETFVKSLEGKKEEARRIIAGSRTA